MSKRKVTFDELAGGKDEEPIWKRSKAGVAAEDENQGVRLRTFKANHTLDSDEEEEDDEKADEEAELEEEDVVEGAEDPTVTVDEGMKLTPFNLREEMSEGHFDADGNYFAKKDDDIRDNWLDNIDWVRVKHLPSNEDESQGEDDDVRPEPEVFAEMVLLMKPGETITKALQRLGGGKKNQKRQNRKLSKPEAKPDMATLGGDSEQNKEDLLKLTGLADDILCRGNYEVYGYTYERIQHLLKKKDEKDKEKEDAAFDMFGEVGKNKLTKPTPEDTDQINISDVVSWEFKWEDEDEAKIYGPYSSQQMQEWVDEEYFKDGVFVRKVGKEKSFHSSRRIDFELYT